jgi:hypothetical protein
MLASDYDLHGLPMTTPHAGRPRILARPAYSPAAIRALLSANAEPAVAEALGRCGSWLVVNAGELF